MTSADDRAYQAPFRSGANVEAYQLEPLRRALTSPRTNLLLADDVGLGKTIEAGLVVQELLLRHRARNAVIVCPPSLALKWQDEMREKFGLEFVVVNSALLADVRRSHGLNANPFRLYPRVIVSMSWLPSARAQRMLRDVYDEARRPGTAKNYAFDILIVDEAHHVAPASPPGNSSNRGYAVDSQRTIATRQLAERCEHRLFLSATPHNGHSESFTALLEMIDNRRFTRGAVVDEQALKDITVRRLKTELTDKDFKARRVNALAFEPAADEQERFAQLDAILHASAKLSGKKRSADLISMLLKKRFLSSPWAFALTLSLMASTHTEAAHLNQEIDLWGDETLREVMGSEQDDEEEGRDEHPEASALLRARGEGALASATSAELDSLLSWAESYQHRPDSRLTRLIDFLDATCRPDGVHWSNERVVIFSEYAATVDWLVGILRAKGYDDQRLEVITGDTDLDEREHIRDRFSTDPAQEPVRVLVATDSAGEGIDLQRHCHRLVNFDVPFNPSRLEQRIGRIDRYGQEQTPEVYHFVPVATSSTYADDLDFMRRIAEKVVTIAGDLGSVNPVSDADIQDRFSVTGAKAKRTSTDAKSNAIINRTLAGGLELNRQLTELSSQFEERRDRLHLRPLNARRVVDTALALAQQPTLIKTGHPDTDAEVFEVPDLSPRWEPTLRGLATRRRPDVRRPITFDHTAAGKSPDLVHVHLGHALMQKCSRLLRNALFSSDAAINRVTAVVVDDLEQSCVAAVSRLVLVGRGGLRLHEEVFLTGVRLKGRDIAEAKLADLLDQMLDRPDLVMAAATSRREVAERWAESGLRDRLDDAVSKRADRLHNAVEQRLSDRREADLARARGIYAAFRANLTDSLRLLAEQAEEASAMFAFADDQRAQRQRDIRTMEDRLASLSEDEARELSGIQSRYADIRPHVSTAALVFALTPADVEGGLR